MDWVIAEWLDEESGERVRAPSYQSPNGVWYRAGVADAGGPTILRMEGEPVDVTKIQGCTPQRVSRNHDTEGALRQLQDRQAAMNVMLNHMGERLDRALSIIERATMPPPFLAATPNMNSPMYPGPNWGKSPIEAHAARLMASMMREDEKKPVSPVTFAA